MNEFLFKWWNGHSIWAGNLHDMKLSSIWRGSRNYGFMRESTSDRGNSVLNDSCCSSMRSRAEGTGVHDVHRD